MELVLSPSKDQSRRPVAVDKSPAKASTSSTVPDHQCGADQTTSADQAKKPVPAPSKPAKPSRIPGYLAPTASHMNKLNNAHDEPAAARTSGLRKQSSTASIPLSNGTLRKPLQQTSERKTAATSKTSTLTKPAPATRQAAPASKPASRPTSSASTKAAPSTSSRPASTKPNTIKPAAPKAASKPAAPSKPSTSFKAASNAATLHPRSAASKPKPSRSASSEASSADITPPTSSDLLATSQLSPIIECSELSTPTEKPLLDEANINTRRGYLTPPAPFPCMSDFSPIPEHLAVPTTSMPTLDSSPSEATSSFYATPGAILLRDDDDDDDGARADDSTATSWLQQAAATAEPQSQPPTAPEPASPKPLMPLTEGEDAPAAVQQHQPAGSSAGSDSMVLPMPPTYSSDAPTDAPSSARHRLAAEQQQQLVTPIGTSLDQATIKQLSEVAEFYRRTSSTGSPAGKLGSARSRSHLSPVKDSPESDTATSAPPAAADDVRTPRSQCTPAAAPKPSPASTRTPSKASPAAARTPVAASKQSKRSSSSTPPSATASSNSETLPHYMRPLQRTPMGHGQAARSPRPPARSPKAQHSATAAAAVVAQEASSSRRRTGTAQAAHCAATPTSSKQVTAPTATASEKPKPRPQSTTPVAKRLPLSVSTGPLEAAGLAAAAATTPKSRARSSPLPKQPSASSAASDTSAQTAKVRSQQRSRSPLPAASAQLGSSTKVPLVSKAAAAAFATTKLGSSTNTPMAADTKLRTRSKSPLPANSKQPSKPAPSPAKALRQPSSSSSSSKPTTPAIQAGSPEAPSAPPPSPVLDNMVTPQPVQRSGSVSGSLVKPGAVKLQKITVSAIKRRLDAEEPAAEGPAAVNTSIDVQDAQAFELLSSSCEEGILQEAGPSQQQQLAAAGSLKKARMCLAADEAAATFSPAKLHTGVHTEDSASAISAFLAVDSASLFGSASFSMGKATGSPSSVGKRAGSAGASRRSHRGSASASSAADSPAAGFSFLERIRQYSSRSADAADAEGDDDDIVSPCMVRLSFGSPAKSPAPLPTVVEVDTPAGSPSASDEVVPAAVAKVVAAEEAAAEAVAAVAHAEEAAAEAVAAVAAAKVAAAEAAAATVAVVSAKESAADAAAPAAAAEEVIVEQAPAVPEEPEVAGPSADAADNNTTAAAAPAAAAAAATPSPRSTTLEPVFKGRTRLAARRIPNTPPATNQWKLPSSATSRNLTGSLTSPLLSGPTGNSRQLSRSLQLTIPSAQAASKASPKPRRLSLPGNITTNTPSAARPAPKQKPALAFGSPTKPPLPAPQQQVVTGTASGASNECARSPSLAPSSSSISSAKPQVPGKQGSSTAESAEVSPASVKMWLGSPVASAAVTEDPSAFMTPAAAAEVQSKQAVAAVAAEELHCQTPEAAEADQQEEEEVFYTPMEATTPEVLAAQEQLQEQAHAGQGAASCSTSFDFTRGMSAQAALLDKGTPSIGRKQKGSNAVPKGPAVSKDVFWQRLMGASDKGPVKPLSMPAALPTQVAAAAAAAAAAPLPPKRSMAPKPAPSPANKPAKKPAATAAAAAAAAAATPSPAKRAAGISFNDRLAQLAMPKRSTPLRETRRNSSNKAVPASPGAAGSATKLPQVRSDKPAPSPAKPAASKPLPAASQLSALTKPTASSQAKAAAGPKPAEAAAAAARHVLAPRPGSSKLPKPDPKTAPKLTWKTAAAAAAAGRGPRPGSRLSGASGVSAGGSQGSVASRLAAAAAAAARPSKRRSAADNFPTVSLGYVGRSDGRSWGSQRYSSDAGASHGTPGASTASTRPPIVPRLPLHLLRRSSSEDDVSDDENAPPHGLQPQKSHEPYVPHSDDGYSSSASDDTDNTDARSPAPLRERQLSHREHLSDIVVEDEEEQDENNSPRWMNNPVHSGPAASGSGTLSYSKSSANTETNPLTLSGSSQDFAFAPSLQPAAGRLSPSRFALSSLLQSGSAVASLGSTLTASSAEARAVHSSQQQAPAGYHRTSTHGPLPAAAAAWRSSSGPLAGGAQRTSYSSAARARMVVLEREEEDGESVDQQQGSSVAAAAHQQSALALVARGSMQLMTASQAGPDANWLMGDSQEWQQHGAHGSRQSPLGGLLTANEQELVQDLVQSYRSGDLQSMVAAIAASDASLQRPASHSPASRASSCCNSQASTQRSLHSQRDYSSYSLRRSRREQQQTAAAADGAAAADSGATGWAAAWLGSSSRRRSGLRLAYQAVDRGADDLRVVDVEDDEDGDADAESVGSVGGV